MINKSLFILSFFLLVSSYILGQEQRQMNKRYYIPKKVFEQKYNPQDSIGFIVRDNDTLIGVENYIKPKGIPVPYEYKDSTFLELYKKIAFNPIHKDSSNSKPMKYWKDDIRIFFSKSMSKSIINEVMEFTEIIDNTVDSLTIRRVKSVEDSNYIIYYNSDYEYLNEIKNKKISDYWISWNGKNQIERAYVRLVKNQMFSDRLAIQMIKEQLFGTLGWFNRNNELDCDNYFAKCYSDNKHLTRLDIELLKYHYSYGICKGTRRKTFEEQHKRSKENLKKHGSKVLFYHEN